MIISQKEIDQALMEANYSFSVDVFGMKKFSDMVITEAKRQFKAICKRNKEINRLN